MEKRIRAVLDHITQRVAAERRVAVRGEVEVRLLLSLRTVQFNELNWRVYVDDYY
jgi:hypothetical protein